MINPEARKQQINHFKEKALFIFTTALRAPLMLMMGCGYAVESTGMRREVHDHKGVKRVSVGVSATELYDIKKHGELIGWVEEGQPIPTMASRNLHSHIGRSSSGPYEF